MATARVRLIILGARDGRAILRRSPEMKIPYTLNINGVGAHPGLDVTLPDPPTEDQLERTMEIVSPLLRHPFRLRPHILSDEETVEEFLDLLPSEVSRLLRS